MTNRIILSLLATATILLSCSKQGEENRSQSGNNKKLLEFSLNINSPKVKSSDGTVTNKIAADVRANIQEIVIEYFSESDVSLGSYDFTADEIDIVKSDNQDGARHGVTLKGMPLITTKVNVYLNVKVGDINNLQTTYKIMEYCGLKAENITLKSVGDDSSLYEVEVPVEPVLSRFEFKGGAGDIKINNSDLPTGITNGTKEQAEALVNKITIISAETSARAEWKIANPASKEPDVWSYNYTVTYNSSPAYTINSIDGYYMNNIPLTKGGALVLNANNENGDWNAKALENYDANTGSMKKMFDLSLIGSDNVIAYNLFPQVAVSKTVGDIKNSMPHFILKLNGSDNKIHWITIRAFRGTDAAATLIDKFEAGKVYILNASSIVLNQYVAKLKVVATNNGNTTPGKEIPEDKDPTDNNPEPDSNGLEAIVTILEWQSVAVVPEW